MGANTFLLQLLPTMSATILIADIPMHLLRKNPDKECKEQITDINMCHQDKEEIAENTTGHQSQQIKDAKATIRNNQMLNKKTESIKGTLKGDKVGLK